MPSVIAKIRFPMPNDKIFSTLLDNLAKTHSNHSSLAIFYERVNVIAEPYSFMAHICVLLVSIIDKVKTAWLDGH